MNVTLHHGPVERRLAPSRPVIFHAFADLFPWLEGAALDHLREDIRLHGVREPIVMLGDAILDGRNRYMCARDLGVEYPVRQFDPATEGDPLAWVISHNLHRRHLTESQRASIAARLANMPSGYRSDIEPSANLPEVPVAPDPVSIVQAAALLNVSERSVKSARKVHADGAPELVAAVDRGQISVSLAAQATALPRERQAGLVGMSEDRAALQRSVLAAVADARKPVDRRNTDYRPNPNSDAVLAFTDNCLQLASAVPDRLADWNHRDVTRARMISAARSAKPILDRFLQLIGDEHAQD